MAGCDPEGRQAMFLVTLPYCVMQAVTPVLLGAGWLDQFRVMNPVVAWAPSLTEERLKEEFRDLRGTQSERINQRVRECAQRTLEEFRVMSEVLGDPSDITPMLPLGVYVQFRYRFSVDDLAKALLAMEAVPVDGVPDLRYAMAAGLAEVLSSMGAVGPPLNQAGGA